MADELDDDFLLEDASSVGSRPDPDDVGAAADADGVDLAAIEGRSSQDGEAWNNESVRGAEPDQETRFHGDDTRTVGESEAEQKENKKRKRKQREKVRKQKKALLNSFSNSTDPSSSVASQPKSYQTDYLFSKLKLANPKLSEMELNEMRVREDMLIDLSESWKGGGGEEDLREALKFALPTLESTLMDPQSPCVVKPGNPVVVMITGNALRATDLARSLRPLLSSTSSSSSSSAPPRDSKPPSKKRSKIESSTDSPTKSKSAIEKTSTTTTTTSSPSSTSPTVAKLFSRHLKLSSQISFLSTHSTPLAIGTPSRLLSLLSNGSLKLEDCKILCLDITWKDEKMRNLLDGKENLRDVGRFWQEEIVKKKIGMGGMKVLLF